MPATLEVFRNLSDGLVQLAQHLLRLRREIVTGIFRRVASMDDRGVHNEPVHSPEKALNAFNSGVLPVEIAVGRCSKQAVETRGISAKAGHHLVGRDYVAQTLRHLRAVLDHHALSEHALDRLIMLNQTHVAHELRPETRIDNEKGGWMPGEHVLYTEKQA